MSVYNDLVLTELIIVENVQSKQLINVKSGHEKGIRIEIAYAKGWIIHLM